MERIIVDDIMDGAKIGLRIRAARNHKKLSAKAVADRLGWAPSRMSRIERAEIRLFVEDLISIARVLDCQPYEFLKEDFNI